MQPRTSTGCFIYGKKRVEDLPVSNENRCTLRAVRSTYKYWWDAKAFSTFRRRAGGSGDVQRTYMVLRLQDKRVCRLIVIPRKWRAQSPRSSFGQRQHSAASG